MAPSRSREAEEEEAKISGARRRLRRSLDVKTHAFRGLHESRRGFERLLHRRHTDILLHNGQRLIPRFSASGEEVCEVASSLIRCRSRSSEGIRCQQMHRAAVRPVGHPQRRERAAVRDSAAKARVRSRPTSLPPPHHSSLLHPSRLTFTLFELGTHRTH